MLVDVRKIIYHSQRGSLPLTIRQMKWLQALDDCHSARVNTIQTMALFHIVLERLFRQRNWEQIVPSGLISSGRH